MYVNNYVQHIATCICNVPWLYTVYREHPHKTDEEPEEMTTEERSEFAEKCKNIGNRGFQVQDLERFFLGKNEGLVTGGLSRYRWKEMDDGFGEINAQAGDFFF